MSEAKGGEGFFGVIPNKYCEEESFYKIPRLRHLAPSLGMTPEGTLKTCYPKLEGPPTPLKFENEKKGAKMGYKTTGWPPKRRAAQAERMKAQQPWLKTKGPKTAAGKVKSSQNAFKSGLHSRDIRALRRALRAQARFLKGLMGKE